MGDRATPSLSAEDVAKFESTIIAKVGVDLDDIFGRLRREQDQNANIFISNNANPYLISPYAPNQVDQRSSGGGGGGTVLVGDSIVAATAGGTIQVQSPINFADGASLYGSTMYTDRIYSGDVVWKTDSTTFPQSIIGSFGGFDTVIITPDATYFQNPTNTYIVYINGVPVTPGGGGGGGQLICSNVTSTISLEWKLNCNNAPPSIQALYNGNPIFTILAVGNGEAIVDTMTVTNLNAGLINATQITATNIYATFGLFEQGKQVFSDQIYSTSGLNSMYFVANYSNPNGPSFDFEFNGLTEAFIASNTPGGLTCVFPNLSTNAISVGGALIFPDLIQSIPSVGSPDTSIVSCASGNLPGVSPSVSIGLTASIPKEMYVTQNNVRFSGKTNIGTNTIYGSNVASTNSLEWVFNYESAPPNMQAKINGTPSLNILQSQINSPNIYATTALYENTRQVYSYKINSIDNSASANCQVGGIIELGLTASANKEIQIQSQDINMYGNTHMNNYYMDELYSLSLQQSTVGSYNPALYWRDNTGGIRMVMDFAGINQTASLVSYHDAGGLGLAIGANIFGSAGVPPSQITLNPNAGGGTGINIKTNNNPINLSVYDNTGTTVTQNQAILDNAGNFTIGNATTITTNPAIVLQNTVPNSTSMTLNTNTLTWALPTGGDLRITNGNVVGAPAGAPVAGLQIQINGTPYTIALY